MKRKAKRLLGFFKVCLVAAGLIIIVLTGLRDLPPPPGGHPEWVADIIELLP